MRKGFETECECGHCYSEPLPFVSSFKRDVNNIIIKRSILDTTHIVAKRMKDNEHEFYNEYDDTLQYNINHNVIHEMNGDIFKNEFKLKHIFNNVSLLNKEKRVIFSYLTYNYLNNITNRSLEKKESVESLLNSNIDTLLHINNEECGVEDYSNLFYNNNTFIDLNLLKSFVTVNKITNERTGYGVDKNVLKRYFKRFVYLVKQIHKSNKYFMNYKVDIPNNDNSSESTDKPVKYKRINNKNINYNYKNNKKNSNQTKEYFGKFYKDNEYILFEGIEVNNSYGLLLNDYIVINKNSIGNINDCNSLFDTKVDEGTKHYTVIEDIDFVDESLMKKLYLKNKDYIDNKLSWSQLFEGRDVDPKIEYKIETMLDTILEKSIDNQKTIHKNIGDIGDISEDNIDDSINDYTDTSTTNLVLELLELCFTEEEIYDYIISISSNNYTQCTNTYCKQCIAMIAYKFKQFILNLSLFHPYLIKHDLKNNSPYNNELTYNELFKSIDSVKNTILLSNEKNNTYSSFVSYLVQFNIGLNGSIDFYKELEKEFNIQEDLVYRDNDDYDKILSKYAILDDTEVTKNAITENIITENIN